MRIQSFDLRSLEPPGERCLAQLARDRALVLVDRVLDELLRDRRAALHGAAVRDVGLDRAQDAADVDAVVLVEALVLDRDDRVLQPRRDVLGVDDDARLRPAEDREDRLARRSRRRTCPSAGAVPDVPDRASGICAAIATSSPNVNAASPSSDRTARSASSLSLRMRRRFGARAFLRKSAKTPASVAPEMIGDLTRNAVDVLPAGRARGEAEARPAAAREARHRRHVARHPHRHARSRCSACAPSRTPATSAC